VSEPAPTPGRLFVAFLGIALSGFGGVLPFARRELVDRRSWLSSDEFNEMLSLCQSLPGPNVVNLSTMVGGRAAGWRGAVAAVTGLVATPAAIVIAVAALYTRFGGLAQVQGAITGLAAAAAGLVGGTALRMAAPLIRRRWLSAGAFMAAAFAAVGLARLPLGYVMMALAPVSIAVAWRRPA